MNGTVMISDRAVMQLAAYIAKKQDGVKRLTDKNNGDYIARILKSERDTKGVYLKKSKQGLIIELCVICRFGTDAAALCNNITDKIKDGLTGMGFKIKTVTVNVTGVE